MKIPKIKDPKNIKFKKPELVLLKNGIKLYLFKDSESKVCKIDFIFKAGTEYQDKAYLAGFANNLIREGTKNMNPEQNAEFFDFYGSYVQGFINPFTSGISLLCPNKFILEVLPQFSELVINPLLPENIFEILKIKTKEKIKIDLIQTKLRAHKELMSLIFGKNHQRSTLPSEELIEKLTISEIKKFVENFYTKGDINIQISGKIDYDLIKSLDENIGSQNSFNTFKPILIKDTVNPSVNKNSFINIPTAEQASVFAGINLGKISETELIDISIFNTILGGYFGARLMKNIREDKGYTYGIYSYIVEYPETTLLLISADVRLQVYRETINEIFKEINILKSKAVHYTELTRVKNYMLGEIIAGLNGAFETSAVWEKIISTEKSEDSLLKKINRIKNISSTDIKKIAEKYLDEDKIFSTVAGR